MDFQNKANRWKTKALISQRAKRYFRAEIYLFDVWCYVEMNPTHDFPLNRSEVTYQFPHPISGECHQIFLIRILWSFTLHVTSVLSVIDQSLTKNACWGFKVRVPTVIHIRTNCFSVFAKSFTNHHRVMYFLRSPFRLILYRGSHHPSSQITELITNPHHPVIE